MNSEPLHEISLLTYNTAIGGLVEKMDTRNEINHEKCFLVGAVSPSKKERVEKFLKFAEEENIQAMHDLTGVEDIDSMSITAVLFERSKDENTYYLFLFQNDPDPMLNPTCLLIKRIQQRMKVNPRELPADTPLPKWTYWKMIKVAFFGGKIE